MKATQMSINRWMDKEVVIHIHNGILLSHKRNTFESILMRWMNLESIIQSDGQGNGTPLQYSCLENPMDGGPWKAAVHEVAKSQTWLSDFAFTFHFHALEKEMATHSSILAWRIPGTGEPGGLPSMGSHRVGHDWSDLAAAAALTAFDTRHSWIPWYCVSHCRAWFALQKSPYLLKIASS